MAASRVARVRFSPADLPSDSIDLGLQTGQDAQRLRIALESADLAGDFVQRVLAVVAERRVSEVMRQSGGVDDVRVTAECRAHLPGDLRHLERVGEPGSREVVLAGHDDLGLVREPAEGVRVQHARPVSLELAADYRGRPGIGPLGRLDRATSARRRVVHRLFAFRDLLVNPLREAQQCVYPDARRCTSAGRG